MRFLFAAVASVLAASAAFAGEVESAVAALSERPAFEESASAREILLACRAMVPTNVTVKGHVNRRSRHGTEKAAYSYVLTRLEGKTSLTLRDKEGNVVFEKKEEAPGAASQKVERIGETDITWSDLSMDFLWWNDVSFDEKAESESLTGIVCKVLLLRNGKRAFRAWIDRRTGALIQANEVWDGKTVREIFCTSLKKFGEKWSPKNIEVGPPGAKYRTKIVVEDVE